jgi:hypothetical protein
MLAEPKIVRMKLNKRWQGKLGHRYKATVYDKSENYEEAFAMRLPILVNTSMDNIKNKS